MSRTAAGAALTANHRRAQLAIRAMTARDLLTVWPLFRGDARSWEEFSRTARTIIRARSRDSAGLAGAYFRAFRAAEGIGGTAQVRLPDLPAEDLLNRSLGAAGLAGTYRALSVGKSSDASFRIGAARMIAAGTRHVLNGARGALVLSTGADGRAGGWTRVTSGNACNFCSTLAGGGTRRFESSADFQAHDGCACFAEPAF